MNRSWKLAVLTLVSLMMVAPDSKGQAGASGLAFLKLGVAGRGSAMSDAMSAVATGAEALYYNPAGLSNRGLGAPGTEFLVTHRAWFQDAQLQFLGGRIELGESDAIGFAITNASVSGIEIRTGPGDPEGTFTARNFALTAGFAKTLSENVSVGIAGKFLFEKIFVDEASGFAIDAGARITLPLDGLEAGIALTNIGSMSTLRNESTLLPSALRAGASYAFALPEAGTDITIASDLTHQFRASVTQASAGIEMLYEHQIAIRGGYAFSSEAKGLSAGLGLRYGVLGLDYAYTPLALNLGNTHTVTVLVNI